SRGSELAIFNTDFFFLLRFTRALPLFLHQSFETGHVDSKAALARHQFGKIERKAVRIVKSKSRLSAQLMTAGPAGLCPSGGRLRHERDITIKYLDSFIEGSVK